MTDFEAKECFKKMDINKDQQVSLQEFSVATLREFMNKDEHLEKAFEQID